jgi:hypothetical protein
MKRGKRQEEEEPGGETAGVSPPSPEPVVEGEAIELPAGPPVADPDPPLTTAYRPPAPEMPFPVAGQPVAVVSSESEAGGVTPLAESAPAYASGHASGTAPSWPEPVMELAAERPEVVVGAAFVGGLLFAMILRRLGN